MNLINKKLQKVLSNKILLYVVFALSVIQMFHFLFLNRFDYIIIYALVAYVIFYFSNNFTLVLGIPLILVTLKEWIFKEGFNTSESEDTDSETTTDTTATDSESSSNKKKKTSASKKSNSSSDSTTTTAASKNEIIHYANETSDDTSGKEVEEEEFNPNQINYATTMMDNLKMYNSVLGSDGFAKMTNDTQELLRQQEMLGRNMQQFAPIIQQMAPFLEKATNLLNGLDMKQVNAAANIFKNT